ncbi:unnamed protein product [Cunninghamella echinulata]
MAKEEYQINKGSEIAKQLFDMALEAYEKEDNDQKTGFGYAKCLIELGRALNVPESLQEGYDLFVAIRKGKNSTVFITPVTQLWHTRAALALALFLRQQKQHIFEERRENLEDSDGEIDEGLLFDLMNKDVVSRQEINLYKEVLSILDEVMVDFKNFDESTRLLVKQVLHDIREYGESLEQPCHGQHIAVLFDTLIKYIQFFPYNDDDNLLTLWGACLIHRQKFIQDEKEKEVICQRAEKLIQQSKQVYYAKNKKENPWAWELYAMLKMTLSNLESDEDCVLKLYDESIDAYRKALELNPDNEKLKEMLEILDGSNDDEE